MKTYAYNRSNAPERKDRSRLIIAAVCYYPQWIINVLLRQIYHRSGGFAPGWPVVIGSGVAGALLIGSMWLIDRRAKGDRRLPSRIDLTDDDILRLYRNGKVYAEIPVADIPSVTADPPGWQGGIALNLESPVAGAKEILVGPYLVGYSDFVHRLHPPRMVQGTPIDAGRWATAPVAQSATLVLVILGTLLVVGLMTLTDAMAEWLAALLFATLAVLIWAVSRLSCSVAEIALRGDRMVVTRGLSRRTAHHLADVRASITPASGNAPERLCIDTGSGTATVSATTPGYLALVERMRESIA